jgi:hypothetical protein
MTRQHLSRTAAVTAVVAAVMTTVTAPGHADSSLQPGPHALLSITDPALETLASGQLSIDPVGAADESEPEVFALPLISMTYTKTGAPKVVRLTGGVRIVGEPDVVDLTEFRVRMPARRGSVKVSSPADTRIPAFDVARLKVTKKKVTGVLLIAPGTSAVLNAQFDTYVFSDGLRFARFEVQL